MSVWHHVAIAGGKPSGKAQTFLGGFLTPDGKAHGRPVGVGFDSAGALLVADDLGNVVWRVTPKAPAAPAAPPPG